MLLVTLRPTLERPIVRFLPTAHAQPDRIRASASGGDAVVDVNVTPARTERGTWILSDLLRRPVGQIAQILDGEFIIHPTQGSRLSGSKRGPYPTLDVALSAIETHTRGQCQLSSSNEDLPLEP
jgi:hypothetical protein